MAWLSEPDEADPSGYAGGALVEGRLRARRSVLPAYQDPAFDALAERDLGAAGFVHLRWATSGLAIAESNTHPFLADGWAFAHQGSIALPHRLNALLAPEWLGRRLGSTDSESYFLYLLQCVELTGDLVGGIRQAVNDVVRVCGPASLNAVLLSSSSLVVVHGVAGLTPPREDLLAAVEAPEDMPPCHLEGYYGLNYRLGEGNIVITSSGIADSGWQEVPDDSIVQIDLGRREVSFHAFDGGKPAGVNGDRPGEDSSNPRVSWAGTAGQSERR